MPTQTLEPEAALAFQKIKKERSTQQVAPQPTPPPAPPSEFGMKEREFGYVWQPVGEPQPKPAEPAKTPTPLELKKQEYSTFAREYVKPVVETGVKAIKEAPPYKQFIPSTPSVLGPPPEYVYQEIEKMAEKVAQLPTARMREQAGQPEPRVGALYFTAGIVKAAESFVKPEIPTALGAGGQYFLQRPQPTFPLLSPIRSTKPLSTYAETLPPGYRGRAELLGELTGEYLIGRYLIGPAVERGYGKAKQVGSTVKQKILGPSTIETGWERTGFGVKGWEYETYRGIPGQPQIPPGHPYIQQEGMEEFLTQTARATSHPVAVHIPKETPWRVIIKHPPTPIGGGLTQTVLRSEISDLSKLALRGVSKKAVLAPYWMAAYAPASSTWARTLAAMGVTAVSKAVTMPKATAPQIVSKPSAPKITPAPLLEVPEALEPTETPPLQQLTPKPRVLLSAIQEKREKIVPTLKPKAPQILLPTQRRETAISLKPSLKLKSFAQSLEKSASIQAATPAQITKAAQIQQQQQIAKTTQLQRQFQTYTPLKMKVPQIFESPTRKRKRKRREEDVFGLVGRQKRFYPVLSPKEVMKIGTPKIFKLPKQKKRGIF